MNVNVEKGEEGQALLGADRVQQRSQAGLGTGDQRSAVAAGIRLQELANNSSRMKKMGVIQNLALTSARGARLVQLQALTGNFPSAIPVVQLAGWTKAQAKRYKDHLRRRAAQRWKDGKNKSADKLVNKYMNARRLANPKWVPALADAPHAGHHVPPLAVANNQNAGFQFGRRGSAGEKQRERFYLTGSRSQRMADHWKLHEAEGMQGVNRSGKFKGNAEELAKAVIAAHHKLRRDDGQLINVRVHSQRDEEKGLAGMLQPTGQAAKTIMENRSGTTFSDVETDSTTSEAESNEQDWKTQSSGSDGGSSSSDGGSSSSGDEESSMSDASSSGSDDEIISMSDASSSGSDDDIVSMSDGSSGTDDDVSSVNGEASEDDDA